MALRAKRNSADSTQKTVNQGGNETMENQTNANTQPQETANTPATQNTAPPAPTNSNSPNAIANMNAGIIDNIEDMNIGGNYVSMDGSEFLYKSSDETAKEIDAVIHYGKRFYQFYDEDAQQYHNEDTKLDDRYKMKFEIRWNEDIDGEPVEHIMTLPTSSAMSFITYVKGLAKKGYAINQVVTRMTVSRQENKSLNIRYSRTEFEMVEALA